MGYMGCRVTRPLKPQRHSDGRKDPEPIVFFALIAALRFVRRMVAGCGPAMWGNWLVDLAAGWLCGGRGFAFRKYKVAPRLGTQVLRRRLLLRLGAHAVASGFLRVDPSLD